MSTTKLKTINCECPPNSKGNKNAIFITIETCCRKPCDGKTSSDNKLEDKEEKEEKREQPKPKRLFKLPIVPERFHGNGCAMEICVLEKHQDNCMYKKDDAEGRTIDDRVGSYECIGRMVVRTCGVGPDEINENQVGTGNFSGVVNGQKNDDEKKTGPKSYDDDKPSNDDSSYASAISEDAMERKNANRVEQAQSRGRGDTEGGRNTADFTSVEYNDSVRRMNAPLSSVAESPPIQKSYYNTVSSAKPQQTPSNKAYDGMSKSSKTVEELSKSSRTAEGGSKSSRAKDSFSKSSKTKSESHRVEQIMLATTDRTIPNNAIIDGLVVNVENGRRHYPGDDCRLHFPRNPFFLQNSHIDQVYDSKKVFPTFVDENNQTDVMHEFPRQKISLETITSLSDLSHRTQRKKSGFWGSLFRKSSPPPQSKKRRRSHQQ